MYLTLIVTLMITAVTGGSVAVAAEQALPGDALYTVKLNVNEPVRAALSLNAKSRAAFEAERAERRLEEAEVITVRAELKPEVRAQIESNFKRFADRARERIADIEATGDTRGAAELSTNFATALRAHEAVLAALTASATSTEKIEVNALRSKVNVETRVMINARARLNTKVKSEPPAPVADLKAAAEGRKNAAENKIQEVAKFIAQWKEDSDDGEGVRVSAEIIARAEAQLTLARTAFAEGEAKLTAAAYTEAIAAFDRARDRAQDAKLIVRSNKELKIDVVPPAPLPVPPVSATSTATSTTSVQADDDESEILKIKIHTNTNGAVNTKVGL